jgi:hypothetical protein
MTVWAIAPVSTRSRSTRKHTSTSVVVVFRSNHVSKEYIDIVCVVMKVDEQLPNIMRTLANKNVVNKHQLANYNSLILAIAPSFHSAS